MIKIKVKPDRVKIAFNNKYFDIIIEKGKLRIRKVSNIRLSDAIKVTPVASNVIIVE